MNWRPTLALVLMAVLAPALGDAQTASRLIPTDHWSYEYIQRLRDRGYLANLNPLVQPYRRDEVVRGLGTIDVSALHPEVAEWVELLDLEFRRELGGDDNEGPRFGASAEAGAWASTSQRLDPLRPLGGEGVWPYYAIGGWSEVGPIVADLRIRGDTYFNDDPDGMNPGQRRGGRSDVAYIGAQFSFGGVYLGRFSRNWSMLGTKSLLLSDVATPHPQFALELRAGRFSLRSTHGELDSFDTTKRWITGHRIDYQTERFVASFGESILYAPTSGGMQLRFMHPLEFKFTRLEPHQLISECEGRDTVLDGLDDAFEVAAGLLEIANEAVPVNIALGGEAIDLVVKLVDERFDEIGMH